LLATVNPGDEVILTDPTYAGMIYRTRLAGGVPVLAPFERRDGAWRLNLEKLIDLVTDRTRALFIMNPSMPSGAVLNREEWETIAGICRARLIWLIYNAAMERILYDGLPYAHPAGLPGMEEWTITVGSVSKEYRMIGWRVGWVVGPESVMDDIGRVGLYNVVSPVGLTQGAAAAALDTPETDLAAAITQWRERRDALMDEMAGLPIIRAAGGWSMLLDVGVMGYDSFTASERLLNHAKIAATPMRDWGHVNGDRFVRFVFSNEPVSRLRGVGEKTRAALPFT
jgi:aspartate/methionine/tyrosine aminotransferase